MKVQRSIENQKERLAKVTPEKIQNSPELRAVQASVQYTEAELDDLAIAPAILPSVPWNAVESLTALGGLVCQIIMPAFSNEADQAQGKPSLGFFQFPRYLLSRASVPRPLRKFCSGDPNLQ